MKHSRLFTLRTGAILGLALTFILLSAFALLAQFYPSALAHKVVSDGRLAAPDLTAKNGEEQPVDTPTPIDQSPGSSGENPPAQDPPLPVTIPTPPIDLPISIPTIPSLPITIPTLPPLPKLPITIPTLPPISLPGL